MSTRSHDTRNVSSTKSAKEIGRHVVSITKLKVHIITAGLSIGNLQGEIQLHIMPFWSLQKLAQGKLWHNSVKAYFRH